MALGQVEGTQPPPIPGAASALSLIREELCALACQAEAMEIPTDGTFMGLPASLSTRMRLPASLAPEDETATGDTISLVSPYSVHLLLLCQTLGFQGSQ